MFPIVGKLHSAIQADNIRLNLAAAEFDRLLPRKRGLSMLTAKNKVEEWPYHPNPQDKFTNAALGGSFTSAARDADEVRHHSPRPRRDPPSVAPR
jgi:hypothetical protein